MGYYENLSQSEKLIAATEFLDKITLFLFSRLSYFDEVHGVIYIASLNGYNLKIEEDSTQNRLIESINLFYILASSSYFANTPFILFLNKTDLFRYVHITTTQGVYREETQ